jgi:hypothetical protein
VENEAPLKGLRVDVSKVGTNEKKATNTDGAGRFLLQDVSVGDWTIEISSPSNKDAGKLSTHTRMVTVPTPISDIVIPVQVSRFSIFKVNLKKGDSNLKGVVYVDKKRYGTTDENIVVQAGLHNIMAESENCRSEDRDLELLPWERIHLVELTCKSS